MKYLLLIYHNEQAWNEFAESERQQIYAEYRKLRDELQERREYLDGSQLQPAATATSISLRGGQELVIDGPFAETHEQLGGYFLINIQPSMRPSQSPNGFHRRAWATSKFGRC